MHQVHQLELAAPQLGKAAMPLPPGLLGALEDVILHLAVLGHLDDGVQGLALQVPEVLLHAGLQLHGAVLRRALRPDLLGQLLEVPHEGSAQRLLSPHALSARVQLAPQLHARAPSGGGPRGRVQVFVTWHSPLTLTQRSYSPLKHFPSISFAKLPPSSVALCQ